VSTLFVKSSSEATQPIWLCGVHGRRLLAMKSEGNPPTVALRPWRASIVRKRLGRLGHVYAVDRATAEAVAIEEFKLDDQERKRLVIEEVR